MIPLWLNVAGVHPDRLVALLTGVTCLKVSGRLPCRFGAVVARCAVGRYACMIEGSASPSLGRFVTVFADVVRRYVIGRLARGFRSVVTTDAIAGDTGMIEGRVAEIIRVMAVFAAVARLRVVNRFADRFHTIMAGCTCFGDPRVIEVRDRPFPGGVAAFAFCLSNNVISRLAGRSDIVVAALAPFRSAGKYTALVTCVTCNFRMGAGQWEPCREMVELFLSDCRRRKGYSEACCHQNCEKR